MAAISEAQQYINKWRRFVECFTYEYQKVQGGRNKCATCGTRRPCNNHACLECAVGGLCIVEFVDPGRQHYGHPGLQGHSHSKRSSVHIDDLREFMCLEAIERIQFYQTHERKEHCIIRRKTLDEPAMPRPRNSTLKKCECCPNYMVPKFPRVVEGFMVCSLECLVEFAEQNPSMQLLRPPRKQTTSNSNDDSVDLPENDPAEAPAVPSNTDG